MGEGKRHSIPSYRIYNINQSNPSLAHPGNKEKHHISLKDHFTQQDPHKKQHHEETSSSAGKTSASAMKTDDNPVTLGEEPKEEHKKKEGLWSKYQHYVSDKNQKEMGDDIWGHYRGPGH